MLRQLNSAVSNSSNIKVDIFTSPSSLGENAFKAMMQEMMKMWMKTYHESKQA